MRVKRLASYGAGGAIVILLAIQAVPVDRSNPPVEQTIEASGDLIAVLRRCCFDCHSNETRWPWYSSVAPASWIVAHDVKEAREKLNFSSWYRLTREERADLRREMREKTEDGEMPPALYRLAHPDARLRDRDLQTLARWTLSADVPATSSASVFGRSAD